MNVFRSLMLKNQRFYPELTTVLSRTGNSFSPNGQCFFPIGQWLVAYGATVSCRRSDGLTPEEQCF